jgi:serine/threonine protein kinase
VIQWTRGTLIGPGGYADVFECIGDDGTSGAMKVLRREDDGLTPYADVRRRFGREVQMVARLDHPNVITVLDRDLDSDPPWFVMPRLATTLASWISGILRSSEKDLDRIFGRVVGAIAYAHEQGVIHRDLHPGNVLMRRDGDPVVSDFGLGKNLWSSSTPLTKRGVGFGLSDYVSPEQKEDPSSADARSDVFMLGKLLQTMVTGVPPVRQNDPRVSEKYRLVVRRATAEDAGERYQSVGEMAEAFARVVAGKTAARSPAEEVEEVLENWRRARADNDRLSVTRELESLLDRESLNERFYRAVWPQLPDELRAYWEDRSAESFRTAARRYDTHVRALPLTGFSFTYLDAVALAHESVFRQTADPELKRRLFGTLLWAGARWDEGDVAQSLRRLLDGVRGVNADASYEALQADPRGALWLVETNMLEGIELPSSISTLIRRLISS